MGASRVTGERSPLHVISYNIHLGGNGRLDRIRSVLARQKPDAAALQEVTSRSSVTELASALDMDLAFGEANSGIHVAWLSRSPIRRTVNRRLETLSKTLLEIEIDWAGEPLSLFVTHLASRHDRQTPAEELTITLDILRQRAGEPHLLAGDFNSLAPADSIGTPPEGVVPRGEAVKGTPRTAISKMLAADYIDCFRTLHPQLPGYTYPSHHPWLRLDYVFASPEMGAHLARCDDIADAETTVASDHLPVEAAFR